MALELSLNSRRGLVLSEIYRGLLAIGLLGCPSPPMPCNRPCTLKTPLPAKPLSDQRNHQETNAASSTAKTTEPGLFLVHDDQGGILLRASDKVTNARVLVPRASSWLYDDEHDLLWTLQDQRLTVTDLRVEGPRIPIAEGISDESAIWVEWPSVPSQEHTRFVERRASCEPWQVAKLRLQSAPTLFSLATDTNPPFLPGGLTWLKGQTTRSVKTPRQVHFFSSKKKGDELEVSELGCDDRERCGLSVPYGTSHLRLVLVRDRFGADCWHRSCLLFDPETHLFASPPIFENPATGALSTRSDPRQWSAAKTAVPGICGPYAFDTSGTTFLVRRYLCRLNEECQDLGGEVIGWLVPGLIVGEPG